MEERKDIMSQMDLIQRKKTSIQAQIEHHMKVRIVYYVMMTSYEET